MTIEPLASVMTMQAQGAIPNKSQVSTETVDNDNVAAVQEIPKIDKLTNVVDNAKNKGHSYEEDPKEQQSSEQTNEQIRKAVEKLNKSMAQSEAVFGIHEDTKRVMIKIVDKKSKEVIKEYPPEKTLDMIAKVWELAGLLVDEKR